MTKTGPDVDPRAERLAASASLLSGFPLPVLERGVRRALDRVSLPGVDRLAELVAEERAAAVVDALAGLADADIEALVGAVLEVAGEDAAGSGDETVEEEDDPQVDAARVERLSASGALLSGFPGPLLASGVERALEHLTDAGAAALRALPPGESAPLIAALRGLPDHDIDALVAAVLEVASSAAAGDEPTPPSITVPAGPVAYELEPGARFDLPARGEHPARTVTVERFLAEGGSGRVWLARDAAGSPVIVKTPRVSGEVPVSLMVERAVLEPLDHPNLVRLLGSHEDAAGNLALFLELLAPNPVLHLNQPQVLERVNVRQLRAPGARHLAPPPSCALELVHDLLRGVEALHAAGLVHNDVKLANLLLAIDSPEPDISDRTYFLALARGAFHAVLIDAGGIRHEDALAEINQGAADPALPPIELTPIWAPPEALLGRLGDPAERPWHSRQSDVYAAALVAYTTITGYLPYAHLRREVDPRDLDAVLDLKRAERRGQVSPIARDLLSEARFQDCRFADPGREGHERCRARFERDLAELLLRRVSPDPAERGSVSEMRADLERAFSIRALPRSQYAAAAPIGDRGPRLYAQHLFAAAPEPGSRLLQAAGGTGRVLSPTRRFYRER